MSAWYIDLHIDIANYDRIRTIIYDKRIDFNFPIVNILFICSIIPAAPVCVVYISQFVFILNFRNRGLLQTRKHWTKGWNWSHHFEGLDDGYHNVLISYQMSVSQMITVMFRSHNPVLSSFMTLSSDFKHG